MIRFEIPVKTLASRDGMNARGYWRTRAGRTQKQRRLSTVFMINAIGGVPQCVGSCPSVVTLTRKHSGVALDDDNLRSMLKAIRDGIADALGIKDNDPRVQWLYRQQKTKRNDFGVIVEIDNA